MVFMNLYGEWLKDSIVINIKVILKGQRDKIELDMANWWNSVLFEAFPSVKSEGHSHVTHFLQRKTALNNAFLK